MSNDLLTVAFIAWLAAALISLTGRGLDAGARLVVSGCVAGILAALLALPNGTPIVTLPTQLAGAAVSFQIPRRPLAARLRPGAGGARLRAGDAGTAGPRRLAVRRRHEPDRALGVFGLRDGAGFLIAWEIMSFGGAVMILCEKLAPDAGRPVLFMLGLLEVGAIALVVAVLLLAVAGHSFAFETFGTAAGNLAAPTLAAIGVLLVIGFGAKLGLLPFYEWFPAAYGAGSGASGALMSGVVLNAAFYGLSRGLLEWAPGQHAAVAAGIGIFVVIVAVLSAVLTALYAFQQDDWRTLLSFSSAENAAIAVAMLGAALIFRGHGKPELASLAWTVALLHLAGHALAKGGLFLAADGVYRSTGGYGILQTDLLRRSSWLFGLGALFAAMSLAAMPPQAGFVSEWYMFETVFQGFRLDTLTSRLVMALAGAGLALTVAIAFATYVKVFGVGLLGRSARNFPPVRPACGLAVGLLGLGVLALAVGMPVWLDALRVAVAGEFGNASRARHA